MYHRLTVCIGRGDSIRGRGGWMPSSGHRAHHRARHLAAVRVTGMISAGRLGSWNFRIRTTRISLNHPAFIYHETNRWMFNQLIWTKKKNNFLKLLLRGRNWGDECCDLLSDWVYFNGLQGHPERMGQRVLYGGGAVSLWRHHLRDLRYQSTAAVGSLPVDTDQRHWWNQGNQPGPKMPHRPPPRRIRYPIIHLCFWKKFPRSWTHLHIVNRMM